MHDRDIDAPITSVPKVKHIMIVTHNRNMIYYFKKQHFYCIALHCIVLYCVIVLYCITLHCMVQCILRYSIELYGVTLLYCNVLNCIILFLFSIHCPLSADFRVLTFSLFSLL